MSDVGRLLSEAAARKIMLWVDDGQLKFRAPSGALSEDIRERLTRHKAEIIAGWPWDAETETQKPSPSPLPLSPRKQQKIPAYLHPLWSQVGKKALGVHFTNATHIAIRYKGIVDRAMLSAALQQLAAVHRILFARIVELPEGPTILFDRDAAVAPIFVDLRSLPEDAREAEAKRRAHELTWEAFAPHDGPLMRAYAIRIAETDQIIGFTLHHFVADLISVRIVATEWLLRYENLHRHGVVTQPVAAISFEDHLAQMETWVASDRAQEARDYWGEHLRNAGPTWLPRRDDTGAVKAKRLGTRSIAINAKVTKAARRFAAACGATLFQVLVAAKIAALAEIGGTTDATIMFFATCRDDPRLMGTVGSLMNLLHLRVPRIPDESFDELTKRVRAAHAGAVKHQLCPFELVRQVQSKVGAWSDLPYAPLFNFMDVQRPTRPRKDKSAAATPSGVPFDIGPPPEVALRDVEFESYYFQLESDGDGLKGFLRYSPLLYEDAVVKRYLAAFHRTLKRLPADA